MPSRLLRAILVSAVILLAVGSQAAWAQDELFVVNTAGASVTVYTRTATGNTARCEQSPGSQPGCLLLRASPWTL